MGVSLLFTTRRLRPSATTSSSARRSKSLSKMMLVLVMLSSLFTPRAAQKTRTSVVSMPRPSLNRNPIADHVAPGRRYWVATSPEVSSVLRDHAPRM